MTARERGGWPAAIVGMAAALAAGCQDQELSAIEPRAVEVRNHTVTVRAKQLPPSIMLVVDRSGSMIESVSGAGLACSVDGTSATGYDPLSPHSCKWNDLKSVLAAPGEGFLAKSEGAARFGLLAFPGPDGDTCSPGRILVPVGDSVQPIRFQLQNQLYPGGGTPTAQALLDAAQDPAMATPELNRRRFVMLLTDGLPNCSSSAALAQRCEACNQDPSSCSAPSGCRPTFGSSNACTPDPYPGAACLDEDGLVSAVKQLFVRGIETFVIGIGAGTGSSDAANVLNRAAEAGGHARAGAPEKYYQANSVQELKRFLDEILQAFPCDFSLDPVPAEESLISVALHDRTTESERILLQDADWIFASPAREAIRVVGSACDTIQNAPDDRYEVQIRYATRM